MTPSPLVAGVDEAGEAVRLLEKTGGKSDYARALSPAGRAVLLAPMDAVMEGKKRASAADAVRAGVAYSAAPVEKRDAVIAATLPSIRPIRCPLRLVRAPIRAHRHPDRTRCPARFGFGCAWPRLAGCDRCRS